MARSMFSFQLTALLRKVAGHRFAVRCSNQNHYREAGISFDGKYLMAGERNEMPRNDIEMMDPVTPGRPYLWRGWRKTLNMLALDADIPRKVRAKLVEVAERLGGTHFLSPLERQAVMLP